MPASRLLSRAALTLGASALLVSGLATPVSAVPVANAAAVAAVAEDPAPTGAECTTTPSAAVPGNTVADPRCTYDGQAYAADRFAPSIKDGQAITRTYTGILGGAAYRMEVPLDWNGRLVAFSHGLRGPLPTVWVEDPDLRGWFAENGYAWVASSYARNGYAVDQAARDMHALIGLFGERVGPPAEVYLTGISMGGHVAATLLERHRGEFDGALPYCGALGDTGLFDFHHDVTATAAALTGTAIRFPLDVTEAYGYWGEFGAAMTAALPQLGTGFVTGDPATVRLTTVGRQWSAAVEERSGGDRPGFDAALAFWSSFGSFPVENVPLLFSLYPGLIAGNAQSADGNVVDNRDTVYRLSGRVGPLTPAELRLNSDVLRVAPTASPGPIPPVAGRPGVPVVSLHNLGDLYVPFSQQQEYAARAAANGEGHLVVTRAIRGVGHCDFSDAELRVAFTDLVRWAHTGQRPAGDAVLDRRAVAAATFGCRFTDKAAPHDGFPAGGC